MGDYWDSFDYEIQSDEFVDVYVEDEYYFDCETEECRC